MRIDPIRPKASSSTSQEKRKSDFKGKKTEWYVENGVYKKRVIDANKENQAKENVPVSKKKTVVGPSQERRMNQEGTAKQPLAAKPNKPQTPPRPIPQKPSATVNVSFLGHQKIKEAASKQTKAEPKQLDSRSIPKQPPIKTAPNKIQSPQQASAIANPILKEEKAKETSPEPVKNENTPGKPKGPLQKEYEAQLSKAQYTQKAYSQGPLNLTPETKAVLDITEALVSDSKSVTFKLNAQREVEITFRSKTQNKQGEDEWGAPQTKKLNDLMKGANFSHINLSKEVLDKLNGTMNKDMRATYLGEKQKLDPQNKTWLKDVSAFEYAALKKYTKSGYTDMNGMLRGTYSPVAARNAVSVFLNCVATANAINKAPDVPISGDSFFLRKEGAYMLDKYASYVKDQKIESVVGFLSTAEEGGTYRPDEYKLKILFRNVVGKDISILSDTDGEKEYLLSPGTQLRWMTHDSNVEENDEGGSKTRKIHLFTVEGANTPDDLQGVSAS